LNNNSLGAKAIQFQQVALGAGTIPANGMLILKYDGTQFQIEGTAIPDASVALTKLATQANGTILANFSGGVASPTASTPDADLIQRTYYASSTSGTSTYTATLAPVPTAYVTGAQYVFTASNTNTGASTMNFNSLGAKTLQLNGAALSANQLIAGATYQSVYDGTNLQITASSYAVGTGMVRIAQVVTSSSATTITFSSIPGTFENLVLKFYGRATGATGVVQVHMKLNSDGSIGNYPNAQQIVGNGASAVAGSNAATADGGTVFPISGTSGATNPLTVATLDVNGYARTAFNHMVLSQFYATSSSNVGGFESFLWASTAAITQIDIKIASGSFANGTVCTLYGES
jgi:hypothetical protein